MSNYPGALDTDLEIPPIEDGLTEISAASINNLRDAILAIQSAVGTDPQGTSSTLAARINKSLDGNGNIKASALEAVGLVAAPVDNSDVATNAAIEESKLDLDFSTSTLNTGIQQNSTLITAQNTASALINSNFTKHVAATSFRHDGYAIDLSNSIRGETTLEAAISVIENALTNHEGLATNAHAASAISVTSTFNSLTATNVQDALEQLDIESVELEAHQDALHRNGVIVNTAAETSEQGGLSVGTMATAVYQTDGIGTSSADGVATTNIVQVLHPNAARITSKNIDTRSIAVGSNQLRIQAGGFSRGTLDVDLSSLVATDDIDGIVRVINTQAAASNYPISAYRTGGELTIANNAVGEDYTIAVLSTISNTVHSELGFGDVADTTFNWTSKDHAAYINGFKTFAFKELLNINYDHSSATDLNRIAPGLGDLSLLGFTIGDVGRVLVNINNHSSDSTANGTYYIQLYTGTDIFDLNQDIPTGTFDIEVLSNSINFSNAIQGQIHDIFVEHSDGYGVITKSQRIAYSTIPGIQIKDVPSDLSETDVKWSHSNNGELFLTANGIEGAKVSLTTNYLGEINVFDPDSSNKVVLEVVGSAATALAKNITVSSFAGTDDRLYLSSVHYSDTTNGTNKLVKFVRDKRVFGNAAKNTSQNKLQNEALIDSFDELRDNGVIRGLEYLSNTSNTITLNGGKALLNGKLVEFSATTINVGNFTLGSNILVINTDGKFEVLNGIRVSDLNEKDAYGIARDLVTILEFSTSGTAISGGFTDRRFLIANIDTRLAALEGTIVTSNLGHEHYENNTTTDLLLAVNSSGSDAATTTRPKNLAPGDYTAEPFITLQEALNAARRHRTFVALNSNQDITITMGAGTFAGADLEGLAGGGTITLQGTWSDVTPTTGAQAGTAGAATTPTALKKPTAAANWTADDLNGSFVRIIGGAGVGAIRPIIDTTTDTLTIHSISGLNSTSIFEIVEPGTIIDSDLLFNAISPNLSINAIEFDNASATAFNVSTSNCSEVYFSGCKFDADPTYTSSRDRLSSITDSTVVDGALYQVQATNEIDAQRILVWNDGTVTFEHALKAVAEIHADGSTATPVAFNYIGDVQLGIDSSNNTGSGVLIESSRVESAGTGLNGSGNGAFGMDIQGFSWVGATSSATITGATEDYRIGTIEDSWADLITNESYVSLGSNLILVS